MDDAGRLLGLRLLLRVVAHARRLRGLPAAPAAERDLGHAFTRFGRRRRVPQARSRAARRAGRAGRGAVATVVARGDGLRRRRRANLQGPRKDAAGAGGVALDVARRPPAGRRFLGRRRARLYGSPRTAQQAPGLDDDGQKVRARHALRRRAHGAARRRLREARRRRARSKDDARLRRGRHQRGVRRRVTNGRRPGVGKDEGRVECLGGGRAGGQVQGLALVRAEGLRLRLLRGRRVVHEIH